MIDDDVLLALGVAQRWRPLLNDGMALWGIDTERRAAFFLAQALHETDDLQRLVADLNLAPPTLLEAWPQRFSPAEAVVMAHDERAIAKRAYAGLRGNGDEASGDGWLYRPRGLLMLAGRRQYAACAAGIGVDLIQDPDLVAEPVFAVLSGAWLFASSGCNELADAANFGGCTRRLAGHVDDLAARSAQLKRVMSAMQPRGE